MSVDWRGVRLDPRTRDMMDEVARLLPFRISAAQGSYNRGGVRASAGTHDGGGAIDVAGRDLTPDQRTQVAVAMRRVGFAAWVRGPAGWAGGFSSWHIHGIAVGCADLSSGAAAQVRQYRAGQNGLAGHGPDPHTRAFVGRTWETYRSNGVESPANGGDDMAISNEDAEKIAWAVWSWQDPAGGQGGPSAATRLRSLGEEIAQVPGRVVNFPLPLPGGGTGDAWTLLRTVYDRITGS